ncbi:MAG: cyclic nucleotide-binding domain-containing protein [Deltaproteobacteria bacterium]|nr:cyclic nucleotide-binding domain-containing protein [Deltaproteobacteria bacterium]
MSEIAKRQLSFKKGDILFREGEPGDLFYFVIAGSVGIFHDYDGRKLPLAVIEKTQAVGDLSVINKSVRSATAVALTDLVVIPVQRESVDEQLGLSPRWFRIPLAKLEKHHVLGEMSVVDGKCRSATAVALSDAELMKITKKGFDDQLAQQRLWFRALIQTLVSHLRHADEMIARSGVHDDALASSVQDVYSDPVFRFRGAREAQQPRTVVSGSGVPAVDATRTRVKGVGESEDAPATTVAGDGGKDLVDGTETLVKGGATTEKPKLVRINSKHRTALVCDPDPEFLAKISERLAKAKIGAVTCSAVDQAQAKLANQKFGCVLINLRVKKGSPEKLVRRIRYLEKSGDEHLRVFMIVADEDARDIESFRSALDGTFSPELGAVAIAEQLTQMFPLS